MKKYAFWSGIIGNIMDQYDVAIYAFLAPFLAPLFFRHDDPVVAIIMAYGLMSVGIITRPLGAFVFGRMAMNHGPKKALIIILIGMTFSTMAMGLVPTYDAIGPIAPALLALVRAMQSTFAAGEVSVAALFILEHEEEQHLGKTSSYYSSSTMIGIGLASLVATWISASGELEEHWRYAFFASLFTTLPALGMRLLVKDLKVRPKQKSSGLQAIRANRWKLLRIILTSSVSYMTYAVPFIFMNSFVPHITSITSTEMLAHTDMLTVLDIVLILAFSRVVDRFRHQKWMALITSLLACSIIPLFYMLPTASLFGITMIRAWIIFLGVAYSDPLNAWFFKLIESDEKYVVTGVGYAIGTELLGRNTTVMCWSLFYYFGTSLAPACYIATVAIVATLALIGRPHYCFSRA